MQVRLVASNATTYSPEAHPNPHPNSNPNPNQVRLVASNAITYSPEADNACNKAARAHLNEFEKQFLKQGLATDDGAAAAEAAEAAKPKRAKRS